MKESTLTWSSEEICLQNEPNPDLREEIMENQGYTSCDYIFCRKTH